MQTPVKQGFRGRNASPTDRRGPEVTQHVIRIQNPNQLSGKIPVCLSLNQKIQSIRCRFFKGLATQTHPLGFKEREIFKKVQSLKKLRRASVSKQLSAGSRGELLAKHNPFTKQNFTGGCQLWTSSYRSLGLQLYQWAAENSEVEVLLYPISFLCGTPKLVRKK